MHFGDRTGRCATLPVTELLRDRRVAKNNVPPLRNSAETQRVVVRASHAKSYANEGADRSGPVDSDAGVNGEGKPVGNLVASVAATAEPAWRASSVLVLPTRWRARPADAGHLKQNAMSRQPDNLCDAHRLPGRSPRCSGTFPDHVPQTSRKCVPAASRVRGDVSMHVLPVVGGVIVSLAHTLAGKTDEASGRSAVVVPRVVPVHRSRAGAGPRPRGGVDWLSPRPGRRQRDQYRDVSRPGVHGGASGERLHTGLQGRRLRLAVAVGEHSDEHPPCQRGPGRASASRRPDGRAS